MSKKTVLETLIKDTINHQKKYISEYNRVTETINNRIADRIAENPNYDPWDAPRRAVELMKEIERLTIKIKIYEKNLEEIS